MAAVTTIASGAWSTGSTVFAGGSGPGGVPSNADTVTIGRTKVLTSITNSGGDCLCNLTSHGLVDGDQLYFRTTGTLPSNLSASTTGITNVYFVVSSAANSFKLALTAGGTPITFTGSSSGTHTCYVDQITLDTAAVASTLTIVGCLKADGTVNTTLTVQGACVSSTGSSVNIDYSGDVTKTCDLIMNNGGNAAGASTNWSQAVNSTFILKGFPKARYTTLSAGITGASSTSCTVVSSTGWQVGDELIFATTQAYNATPRVDKKVTDTTATSWAASGAVTYDHATGGYVGNLTSNVVYRPNTAGGAWGHAVAMAGQTRTAYTVLFQDVEFRKFGDSSFPNNAVITMTTFVGGDGFGTVSPINITNCSFNDERNRYCIQFNGTNTPVARTGNIYYTPANSGSTFCQVTGASGTAQVGTSTDEVSFLSLAGFAETANLPNSVWTRARVSSSLRATLFGSMSLGSNITLNDCDIWSNAFAFRTLQGTSSLNSCRIGTQYSQNATNGIVWSAYGTHTCVATDCIFQSGGTWGQNLTTDTTAGWSLQLVNKGVGAGSADPAVQEIYTLQSNSVPALQRDATTAVSGSRSTSSIETICSISSAISQSFTTIAKAGETITVITYVRKSGTPAYGASTLPSVTISGLGITPVTSTMSGGTAADTWEKLTTQATNSTASDGLLTVTFTAQSATAGAIAWFAGTPDAPFVTRCRHYGYLFDETIATRTTNVTVSAAEATAAAYTGMAVTWNTGATPSTTAITADNTFQKLYDYTQAEGCLNVESNMPITGAGVAGNAALFAQGDITISTTKVLNGSGSISMGSYILTTEFASGAHPAYTYTGGTWSQLTTVPSVSGGTLAIAGEGTYTFGATDSIVTFAPTASAVTYNLAGGTFSGTIDLRNTHATRAITVELPVGTTYTTASNTGAAITVTYPVTSASISITSIPNTVGATDRLQIINVSAQSASAWQSAHAYVAGDMVLRTTGIGTESTAGLYFRCTTAGTTGVGEPTWDTTVGNTTADGTAVWTTYKVLYYDNDPAATSYSNTYIDGEEFLAGETYEVRFVELNGATSFYSYSTTGVTVASGFSVLVSEVADDVYAEIAVDGSTLDTTFSPNYTSNYIVMDTNTDFAGQGAYAYYCYLLTTSQGMYKFWDGITALDSGNFRIETDTISLYFDESAGFVKQTDSVRIFRKDGTRPALDPTTGGNGIEINWRVPVNVVSTSGDSVITGDIATLTALIGTPQTTVSGDISKASKLIPTTGT